MLSGPVGWLWCGSGMVRSGPGVGLPVRSMPGLNGIPGKPGREPQSSAVCWVRQAQVFAGCAQMRAGVVEYGIGTGGA